MKRWKLLSPEFFFVVVCLAYLSLMVGRISLAYLDFGDGNYLYIARRMLQGVVIYKDIMSPQPPMHLLVGTVLLRIGDWLDNPLIVVRVFTLILRTIHAVLIYLIATRLFNSEKRPWLPFFAGTVYLFLPIGFWWSRGYQSEPLEILWLLLMLWTFLKQTPKCLYLSGVFGALSVLTNMTAAPYLLATLVYLIFTDRKKLSQFALPSLGLLAVTIVGFQIYTQGMFLQNTLLDQVGTYPKENTLSYMLGKIKWIGGTILILEGGLIAASLAGLVFFWKEQIKGCLWKDKFVETYILLAAIGTLLSFLYATKGGTVDYIFTLGEPAVALFSAYCAYRLLEFKYSGTAWVPVIAGLILLLLSYPSYLQNKRTLNGLNYELKSDEVKSLVRFIDENSTPNEPILAPPYFAFLANRPIAGEFSEQYVWFIKYVNYMKYREGNPDQLKTLIDIGEQMSRQEVKVVILNMDPNRGQQTGKIGPFRQAVEMYYESVAEVPMRNETLTLFLPMKEQ